MSKFICPECGEENGSEYKYCKNCGALLDVGSGETEQKDGQPAQDAQYGADNQNNGGSGGAYGAGSGSFNGYNGSGFYGNIPLIDNIEGVPSNEVAAFVGKKAPKILSVFSKMQFTGSKLSWCWPAAILGLLFGPFGTAIWCFYRKMYKIGLVLMAVGIVFSMGFAYADRVSGNYEETSEIISEIVGDSKEAKKADEPQALPNGMEQAVGRVAYYTREALTLATGILGGLFAFYFYKKFTVEKILEFRTRGAAPNYYALGLSVIGGTSDGMAVVAVLLMFAANSLSQLLMSLLTGFGFRF